MRMAFTGRYADLKHFGFKFQRSEGRIHYFWEHPDGEYSYLGVQKAGNRMLVESRLESLLHLILPYIQTELKGDVPDKLYYNRRTHSITHTVDEHSLEFEFCKDFERDAEVRRERAEQGLPPLKCIYTLYNKSGVLNVLYRLYEQGYLTEMDDFGYHLERIFD